MGIRGFILDGCQMGQERTYHTPYIDTTTRASAVLKISLLWLWKPVGRLKTGEQRLQGGCGDSEIRKPYWSDQIKGSLQCNGYIRQYKAQFSHKCMLWLQVIKVDDSILLKQMFLCITYIFHNWQNPTLIYTDFRQFYFLQKEALEYLFASIFAIEAVSSTVVSFIFSWYFPGWWCFGSLHTKTCNTSLIFIRGNDDHQIRKDLVSCCSTRLSSIFQHPENRDM